MCAQESVCGVLWRGDEQLLRCLVLGSFVAGDKAWADRESGSETLVGAGHLGTGEVSEWKEAVALAGSKREEWEARVLQVITTYDRASKPGGVQHPEETCEVLAARLGPG